MLLMVYSRLTLLIIVMAVLVPLIPCAVNAAVVVLKNGDRITGRIVKMEDRKLEIDSDDSSDIVTIKWEQVRSITTERPMSIKLYGEAPPPENVGERVRDRIILHTLEEGGLIRLEDVRNINLAEQDYRGYVSIGGNQTSGNTQTQAMNLSGNLTYRKSEHRFILDAKYNRAEADGDTTANNGSVNIQYDYFLAPRFYTGAFNLTENDQFQNLSLRNTTGIGLGYDILDSEQHLLTVIAGPGAVYEDFTTTPATITPSATWLARYELRFRGDDVVLFHKQQGFKDLGHGSATRVNADQGIRIKITRQWRINFEYDLRYNSRPVTGRKATDTNIIFGFSYDFKP
jgi:putative salt-induced outer membrane protein